MGTDGGADKQKAGAAHEGKDENCSAMSFTNGIEKGNARRISARIGDRSYLA